MEAVKDTNENLRPVALSAEEKLVADKKMVEEFVNNPKNKQAATELAVQIFKELPNWFTSKHLLKRFKIDEQSIELRLAALRAFNLIACKTEKQKNYYKIDLNHRAQRDLINQEISFHEGCILFLKEKLAKLD